MQQLAWHVIGNLRFCGHDDGMPSVVHKPVTGPGQYLWARFGGLSSLSCGIGISTYMPAGLLRVAGTFHAYLLQSLPKAMVQAQLGWNLLRLL